MTIASIAGLGMIHLAKKIKTLLLQGRTVGITVVIDPPPPNMTNQPTNHMADEIISLKSRLKPFDTLLLTLYLSLVIKACRVPNVASIFVYFFASILF